MKTAAALAALLFSAASLQALAGKIHDEAFVRIGGIEQWIAIKGDNDANPAILFLHGGPGNPLSPYADALHGAWARDFTLVQWDQRGAGRTFGRSKPAAGSTLTVERMAQDGIEVAEHVVRRLGQEKVILLGGSWGSVLGVHMARARPDLFHAYVGVSQLVNGPENQSASYAAVMALARAAADQATVGALEALGPPPWTNPRNPGILRRATRAYEAKTASPAPESWWALPPEYATPAMRESDSEAEDYSYLQFVGMKGEGMLARIDLPKLGLAFRVPVFLIQGTQDLVSVPAVTKRYFESITAPEKELVMVPRAGHDPNAAMIEAEYKVLMERARPRAR